MSGKQPQPLYDANPPIGRNPMTSKLNMVLVMIIGALSVLLLNLGGLSSLDSPTTRLHIQHVPFNSQEILVKCAGLRSSPGSSQTFSARDSSDRFELGTNATLILNATIFTGEKNATVPVHGDILLDRGIVKSLGNVTKDVLELLEKMNVTTVDAKGGWVTPGLVDIHSHIGVSSIPFTDGAHEVDSKKGPILPYIRSIDAFNTHDDAFKLAIAGGVTSVQVLPGTANNLGGQAYIVKLRTTSERSSLSMVVEPPQALNISDLNSSRPSYWRHMIQSCGENSIRYGTRMDSIWALRSAYQKASKIKSAQDVYCSKAEAGLWESLDERFPEDLQWELLVDVLRGKVKVSSQCSEAVDLDAMVRLSNEFEFPIASFLDASDAWLVPKVLNRTWGGVPAVALFATNHRSKRESYRGSEFAPRILADADIPVVMKSSHPILNSRYLLYEAQQAHYYGLPPHLALASVTSTPAIAVGLSHRIGILYEGSDADVVLWDSHPLQLGATPVKVWIDGIMQIPLPDLEDDSDSPSPGNDTVSKGKEGEKWRVVPDVPNWDRERKQAVRWEGEPPLWGRKEEGKVVFSNVKEVWTRGSNGDIRETFPGSHNFDDEDEEQLGNVVVEKGEIICVGEGDTCLESMDGAAVSFDLEGGSISPGLMAFGSRLGLEEIASEASTGDGETYNAFVSDIPPVLGDVAGVMKAMDSLMFGTRHALTAYRSGVTSATSSLARPLFSSAHPPGVIAGLSTTFRTGSLHAMELGAIVQGVTALHVAIARPYPIVGNGGVSVSEQIAALRRLLYGWESTDTETGVWFKKAAEGVVPLVIDVNSADIMASLLIVKAEVEDKLGTTMRMVFAGGSEAHLLAKEIGAARVGVILNPPRAFPATWDDRRILPGPPLSNDTSLVVLLQHGVSVGIGGKDPQAARNLRFDISWAMLESNGHVDKRKAYALASKDLEDLLGVRGINDKRADLVAYKRGGVFDLSSKVIGVISQERGGVDFFSA